MTIYLNSKIILTIMRKEGELYMTTESKLDYNWSEIVADLNSLLKVRSIPIGMKLYTKKEEMEAVPRIRRPKKRHLLDQLVAQSVRLGFTIGVTANDLAMKQCGAIVGLMEQDEEWFSGDPMAGVWFESQKDAALHQHSLDIVPDGQYEALAVSPLEANRIENPDICLFYGTPGQMMIFINGLQWDGFKKFEWSVVGESSCADSWGRALSTKEPSLSIPCYAERRYGGVLDEEMLMALTPEDLVKGIEGMKKLSGNGLRYPIPAYGIQADPRETLEPIYPEWVQKD